MYYDIVSVSDYVGPLSTMYHFVNIWTLNVLCIILRIHGPSMYYVSFCECMEPICIMTLYQLVTMWALSVLCIIL